MPVADLGCVTVSNSARTPEIERAKALAQRIGLPFLPLEASTVPRLVVERAGVHLDTEVGTIRSHPGMGLVRVRRLVRATEHDPLVDLMRLEHGDQVLDATFGFGQDALVLAWGVGEEGRVTALESSPLLAGLALAGMHAWPKPAGELTGRIALAVGDARTSLAAAPDASFDVVYFDPMFRKRRGAAPDFAVLRSVAEKAPLDAQTLAHARRVARRLVVVKDGWPGHDLLRLGHEPVDFARRAEIVFGLWEPLRG